MPLFNARPSVSSRRLLPQSDDVSGRIANGGDPEVSFLVRRLDDLAAVREGAGDCFVDAVNVNVRQQAGLTTDGAAADPPAGGRSVRALYHIRPRASSEYQDNDRGLRGD